MKYFLTYEELNPESTNYLEFTWNEGEDIEYWSKDSLYLDVEVFDSIDGMAVLSQPDILRSFDIYYNTTVSQKEWEKVKKAMIEMGGVYEEIISELSDWIGDGFSRYPLLMILGV